LATLDFSSFIDQKKPFKIGFFGDVFCNTPEALESVVNNDPFYFIRGWMRTLDFTTANLETTIGKETTGFPKFSANELFVEYLKGKFDLLFTANNHCFDYETNGLINTVVMLDKHGIQHLGTSKPSKISRFLDITLNGFDITFLNYTTSVNGKEIKQGVLSQHEPNETEAKLINFYDESSLKEAIDFAKKKSDLIIVEIHRRVEGDVDEQSNKPTDRRVLDIDEIISFGADVVIGGHPHEFQGGKIFEDGKAVTYSLGNAYSDMQKNKTESGCVMVMKCDAFTNITYSFLPIATVTTEKFGKCILPLAPLTEGAYNFIPQNLLKFYSEKLESIRNILIKCGLEEEVIPVQYL
jgi:poly-gamma-glutamate synthesis protein (capsule biosynthesis protein)